MQSRKENWQFYPFQMIFAKHLEIFFLISSYFGSVLNLKIIQKKRTYKTLLVCETVLTICSMVRIGNGQFGHGHKWHYLGINAYLNADAIDEFGHMDDADDLIELLTVLL